MSAPARQTSAERTALQVARLALQSADTAYGIPDAIVSALAERGLLMDPEIAAVMASAGVEIQRLNERIVELETAAEKVATFCAARAEYIDAINNCSPSNEHDYWRWQGHAESRRQLSQTLGLPVGWPAGYAQDAAPEAVSS